jgi:hypothetical protein
MNQKISAVSLLVLLTLMPAVSHAAQQETFASPEQAASALIDANRNGKEDELLKILGPEAADLISSGDPVADKNAREKFVTAYDKAHAWEKSKDSSEILIIGDQKWPLPIPLVHEGDKWRFDTKSGRQEIIDRRIGRNELNVIKVCRAYVEAQADFANEYPGQHEYAQKFKSTPGQHDGLYWPAVKDEKESPLGGLMASAEAEGYTQDKRAPYHGYYYKILKTQSAAAHGGAKDYIVKGHMTGGFALLAYPAKYGDSGIKTFIVNQAGIVHEKDLGPKTTDIAAKITKYDPDKTWQIP